MAWTLNSDRPIFAQLAEQIQMQIVSGYYPPGGKLPSVRDLAMAAAVNPNTMQKAFSELERSGLIVTQRTNGRTVTEDVGLIRSVRAELAKARVSEFFSGMKKLGYTEQEVVGLCGSLLERESPGETAGTEAGDAADTGALSFGEPSRTGEEEPAANREQPGEEKCHIPEESGASRDEGRNEEAEE